MKHKKKPILIAIICVLLLAAVLACLWFFWIKDAITAANATPAYVNSVSAIVGMNTGANPRYSGIVEPQKTHKINKDDTKTVAKVLVEVGDPVQVGDVLFQYDTEEMQIDLRQAEIDLTGITNRISTLRTQKTNLEKEKKNASKDDQYSYTVEIQSTELQIEQEEYNTSVKKSEIEKLKKALDNADVLSEVEGVVKEVNLTPKTDSTGQQLPFISILSSGEYRIKGTISELNLSALSEGQEVTVHSRLNAEQVWKGKVESIDTEPSSDQNSTGMYYYGMDSGDKSSKYNFYVVLDNLEGLILGQHVYIEPDLGEEAKKTGLWLPAAYLAQDDSGRFVWARNEKERLEKRKVFLGDYDSDNDMYEIKSGVSTVDYIAYPSDTLKEGIPTTVDASAQQYVDMAGGDGYPMDGAMPLPEGDSAFPAGDEDGLAGSNEIGGEDGYTDSGEFSENGIDDAMGEESAFENEDGISDMEGLAR